MDDSCAVCADTLEWVAYGPCGHREVCSTCIARLRVICLDRRCCICKTESDHVFVTKAMGDYTKVISDFSVFPADPKEGRTGSYWYNDDTQAFFDDSDHYKMIKAMCKLSCSICDYLDEQQVDEAPKRRARFRNIKQLKDHLRYKHRSEMCDLCLEGREVFICEQKIYTKSQLNQHIRTGDSVVDGTESERGGFSGHPFCESCNIPFYGEAELYSHMSTEHYTCHICQRQNHGQMVYYKNYDDLEMHFRGTHFLCEDESCLAKKFVVFLSEAEMKRHNAVEHGGRMSRSKRNAALQIPTSFIYSQRNEPDHHRERGRGRGRGGGRGRGRTFRPDFSEEQLSMAIEASLGVGVSDDAHNDSSSSRQVPPDVGDSSDIDLIVPPFDSLSTTDSEAPSRYLQALGHSSMSRPLQESLFPPLSSGPGSSQTKITQDSDGSSSNNTMAAHLRRKNKRNMAVVNSGQAWPAARQPSNNSAQAWPSMNVVPGVSRGASQLKASTSTAPGPLTYASSAQVRPPMVHVQQPSSSSRDKGSARRITHSASAPNLVEKGSSEPSLSEFPPVSVAAQPRPLPLSSQALPKSEVVQTANQSLVEKIRTALDFDEEKYNAFKDITGQYRQGTIDAERYLNYVYHFKVSHLLLDLARLCPDSQKQKQLIETYNARVRSNAAADQGSDLGRANDLKKGKAKVLAPRDDSSKHTLADNFMSTVQKLQSYSRLSDEDVEVLSKDGYRGAKGKSKLTIEEPKVEPNKPLTTDLAGKSGDGNVQRKKTSKFLRARLGDGSAAALLDIGRSQLDLDPTKERYDDNGDSTEKMHVRGVWRNGGGQRLFP